MESICSPIEANSFLLEQTSVDKTDTNIFHRVVFLESVFIPFKGDIYAPKADRPLFGDLSEKKFREVSPSRADDV